MPATGPGATQRRRGTRSGRGPPLAGRSPGPGPCRPPRRPDAASCRPLRPPTRRRRASCTTPKPTTMQRSVKGVGRRALALERGARASGRPQPTERLPDRRAEDASLPSARLRLARPSRGGSARRRTVRSGQRRREGCGGYSLANDRALCRSPLPPAARGGHASPAMLQTKNREGTSGSAPSRRPPSLRRLCPESCRPLPRLHVRRGRPCRTCPLRRTRARFC